MIAAKTKYFKIKNPETGEFEALISIKGEKGDLGGLSNITSEFGDSEELAISQYLSNKINERLTALEELDISTNFSTLYEGVSVMQSRVGTPIPHSTSGLTFPIFDIIGAIYIKDNNTPLTIYEWLSELDSRISALEGN